MEKLKIVLYIVSSILLCSCASQEKENNVAKESLFTGSGLVAYWDFAGNSALTSKGADEKHTLTPVGNVRVIDDSSSVSGSAIVLDGESYLKIPYEQTGSLNVKSGKVTVLAWVNKAEKSGIGFIAGMWNEYENGGKRQYGLFVSLPHYNGADQVCGHISRKGGATYPFPYSIDYSASSQKVPFEKWTLVAFTYDGRHIRSYVDGKFGYRNPELIKHTTGYKGYPNGLVQSKNPYYYPDGIGDNGSDFTVGAVRLKRGMGNLYKGKIGAIAVYNRALSDAEILEIYNKTKGK